MRHTCKRGDLEQDLLLARLYEQYMAQKDAYNGMKRLKLVFDVKKTHCNFKPD